MIKIEGIKIEEFRGVRSLELEMSRKSFVIRGPNGSGKSGVVDAIEFALTGTVSRLSGKGTGGLSVGKHGPHVDRRDHPDAAVVTLRVYIPELDKSATITRRVKQPQKPEIEPQDADVLAVLQEVAARPELTLTRREIMRFILVEASKRSEEVQAVLRLDSIHQIRGVLKTAQNKVGTSFKVADDRVSSDREALRRHLDVEALKSDTILPVVNAHRETLGLPALSELTTITVLDDGVTTSDTTPAAPPNKGSALRDVGAAMSAVVDLSTTGVSEATAIVTDLDEVAERAELAIALKQSSLVRTGLELIVGPECPLCDLSWEMDDLRTHLQQKLQTSEEAEIFRTRLESNGSELARAAGRLSAVMKPAASAAHSFEDGSLGKLLDDWRADLDSLAKDLRNVDQLPSLRGRLVGGWTAAPPSVEKALGDLKMTISSVPDTVNPGSTIAFLCLAQERFASLQLAKNEQTQARHADEAGKATYKSFCDAAEGELAGLYRQVEARFSDYYKQINADDEGGFSAKLEPTEGKLDLSVDFYDRGMFPPAAYHSEGHQDGMGVCLYLALMQHLLEGRFTMAVLDDVVTSVDSEHRREFCHLLKQRFPDTQFIITTHDQVWAEQMRSSGLVTSGSAVSFYGWSVDAGPMVEATTTAWEQIDEHLGKNNIGNAAGALRRYLESVSRELAGNIGAQPTFRPDNSYDLGDLLPSVVKRYRDLLGKAAKAAQSWKNTEKQEEVKTRKEAFSSCVNDSQVEQWTINKAVHYNAWANFSRPDFEPVVEAFKRLLTELRCDTCESWVYASPRHGPEILRCSCSKGTGLNLKQK